MKGKCKAKDNTKYTANGNAKTEGIVFCLFVFCLHLEFADAKPFSAMTLLKNLRNAMSAEVNISKNNALGATRGVVTSI